MLILHGAGALGSELCLDAPPVYELSSDRASGSDAWRMIVCVSKAEIEGAAV